MWTKTKISSKYWTEKRKKPKFFNRIPLKTLLTLKQHSSTNDQDPTDAGKKLMP